MNETESGPDVFLPLSLPDNIGASRRFHTVNRRIPGHFGKLFLAISTQPATGD